MRTIYSNSDLLVKEKQIKVLHEVEDKGENALVD